LYADGLNKQTAAVALMLIVQVSEVAVGPLFWMQQDVASFKMPLNCMNDGFVAKMSFQVKCLKNSNVRQRLEFHH
jgi:hypothetical protein